MRGSQFIRQYPTKKTSKVEHYARRASELITGTAASVPRPTNTAWLRLDTTTTVLLLYDYDTGAACLGADHRHGGA
ncbi:hypothetical protein F442_01893 [Phytophthora nicotianae P10297]|uniref:Uncharacterized protein n=1 Tax=Phytophthora nicotianae P10297 TaxID=1317064 RepID=W3A0W0_PHYNI|nr:hypothetical protein F442_01893 [Phytophthora nicotianae P10297]